MSGVLNFGDFTVQVIHSRRKTIGLRVRTNGAVELRCDPRVPKKELVAMVESHRQWILEKRRAAVTLPPFTAEELANFTKVAKAVIPQRVAHFASMLGVTWSRISIRRPKTRWGSCSAAGNLNFHCLLAAVPPDVRDYVVIHELCHRLHMNHSPAFWQAVAGLCPEYKTHRRWLREQGREWIGRLP